MQSLLKISFRDLKNTAQQKEDDLSSSFLLCCTHIYLMQEAFGVEKR